MKTYSMDLRERLAPRFWVSIAWVYRLLQRRRQTGSIAFKPRGGGHPPAFDEAAATRLARANEATPGATLAELRHAAGAQCSLAAVHRALRRLGITRIRNRSGPPSKTGRS
jgi:transposase